MPKDYIVRRKARHNAKVRNNILQAARRIASEKGWRGVSIRKIAEAIEYSPPVIYQHFKDGKTQVLRTLQEDGFALLAKKIERAQATAFAPESQLVNISLAYWQFAQDYAELYQVMFNLEGVFVDNRHTEGAFRKASAPVLALLKRYAKSSEETEELFLHWWALVHGFVALAMSQRQLTPTERAEKATQLQHAVSRFVGSLQPASLNA